jgi:hypothetical protein
MATRVVIADSSQGACRAASIRANGHDIKSQEAHTVLNDKPLFSYEVCPNFLPRPKYTEQLHAHFARASHHGQFARVILWGQAGFGKRQLAIHFATEYGRRSRRKVLWVDGEGIETLARDYRQAYLALTGSQVLASSPYFSLHYMLSHIKRTLEKRHDEWFLVLLNAGSDTENPDPNASGVCPADYLPTCGQTLATTSSVFGEITPQNGTTPRLWMGLKLANTLAVNIEGLEPQERALYYEKVCGGSREDIEQVDCTKSFGLGFPQLALALSHMRWLQLDPLRYASVMEPSPDKTQHNREDAAVPRGISPGYPSTLDSIWWSVIDSDSIAAQLLLYISLFGPRHLPWNLLQRIWDLKEMNARELLESRNLLAAVGLISVHSSQEGIGDELNVHSLLHQWLRNRVREIYNNEAEYTHAMFDVVDIMANLVIHDAVHDRNKLWNIIGHILRVVGMCTKHGLESSSCAALFSHFALFLYDEGAFVRMAERLINGAISTAMLVAKVSGERDHGGHCLASMRETRVRILLFLFRPQEAKVELTRAIAETKIFPVDEEQKQLILRRLRDLDAEVAFLDDDHPRVMRILEADLQQECFSDFEKARKHHWMAKSSIVSGSVREALRHSHMAVSYWYGFPDRWHQAEMLRWVDWHTTVLKCVSKWNAASLILPDLLDHYLNFVPPTSEEVWRAACGLGRTLAHRQNVYGHEALIIKVLSAANVTEIHGHSLTYCLMMLRDFASVLQARGRLVEAEGIHRHNIEIATCKKPPELGDDGTYDYTKDRILLVACLYSQGRRKEARALLEVFKKQQGFHDDPTANENLTAVLHECHQADQTCLDTYREALEIIRAGHEQFLTNFSVTQIERALHRYGCLEDRLHEYGDPMFDIDATGIAFARSSKVLHLLDYTVVYLAFLDRTGKCDDLWSPKDQVVLGQYFTWCECRRHRRRSGSLNPVELVKGQFLRKSSDDHVKIKTNKRQLSITGWLRRTTGGAGHKYNGENLPERESEALEKNATQKPVKGKSCPDADHCLSKFAASKQQPNTLEFFTGKNPFQLDPETGDCTWIPFFLQEGDHELDLEHVAIANAIKIPVIRITGTAGESAGPAIQHVSMASVQMRITSYFPKLKERFLDYRASPPLEKIQEEGCESTSYE